jgi:hypothetical protein
MTMGLVFGLVLRQTEVLIGSIIELLRLDLAVSDHSTLSRRGKTLDVPRPGGPRPAHCICSWTARAGSSAEPANGWLKSTEHPADDPGANYISASMPIAARSSPSR